jgi:hypothetical protein
MDDGHTDDKRGGNASGDYSKYYYFRFYDFGYSYGQYLIEFYNVGIILPAVDHHTEETHHTTIKDYIKIQRDIQSHIYKPG